jgi:predicted PurR-regulated permease PerM
VREGQEAGRPSLSPSFWVQVKRYIGFKVLLSALTGLVVGASLLLLRVDLALVFGLLAFLLNFIPTVGGVVSTLLPMPVVIFDPVPALEEAEPIARWLQE